MDSRRVRSLVLWLGFQFIHFIDGSWKIDISQQNDKFQGDLWPMSLTNMIRNPPREIADRYWPYGLIPYVIGRGYTELETELILKAMDRINQLTCIKFFPRTIQKDYIVIMNTREGCYTTGIGRMGGPQKVSLQGGSGASCMYYDIIVHELLHVIGLGHEHNRIDRDRYVRIHLLNVMPGAAHQFIKFSPLYGSQFDKSPYDYSSIMHYHAFAFSKDGVSATVEPRDGRYFDLIGHAFDMSYYDLLKVAEMYQCPELSNRGFYCRDRSPFCKWYHDYCDSWEVMRFYCHRTCGLCH